MLKVITYCTSLLQVTDKVKTMPRALSYSLPSLQTSSVWRKYLP